MLFVGVVTVILKYDSIKSGVSQHCHDDLYSIIINADKDTVVINDAIYPGAKSLPTLVRGNWEIKFVITIMDVFKSIFIFL